VKPIKIVFLVRALTAGGAERQLVALAIALHERGIPVVVIVFYPSGCFEKDLRERGVPLVSLDKKGRWDIPVFLFRLLLALRRQKADVIHGYLAVENVLLALLKPFLGRARIVWGVRGSLMDMAQYDWLARSFYRVEAKLSGAVDLIIANSTTGANDAIERGFPKGRTIIIPNGIDTARFAPDVKARRRLRNEWRIGESEILIGRVGRLDPMKDYPTFLKGAQLIARGRPNVRFVCVGEGRLEYTQRLKSLCEEYQVAHLVIWAGVRADMAEVYSALDLFCSSSAFGEGFPNTIAEAMTCGLSCVVTDVGDSAAIVGSLGIVVPPGDPEALARGCETALERSAFRSEVDGAANRGQIEDNFGVNQLADRTLRALWKVVLERRLLGRTRFLNIQ
jgi:glycosyltransferase involved in cell wall biosynthesis